MSRGGAASALRAGVLAASGILLATVAAVTVTAAEPGPPFPPPVPGRVVYDEAGILAAATEAEATRIIEAIEARTGAEVVVYTQLKPEADTPEEAERDAHALLDQWGVGRAGFFDGLVILFDVNRFPCLRGLTGNGQVQLRSGAGYEAAYLSSRERQRLFDEEMLPLLRSCDEDGALLRALAVIDANATPEHARALERARQVDAVLGLLVAPLLLIGLVAYPLFRWLRFGRDPVYLDDPSILMPAPPPDLTAAGGALLLDGRSTRHTLTTAIVDLASRGDLRFREERSGLRSRVALQVLDGSASDDPAIIRARRRPLSDAEDYVLRHLRVLAGGDAGADGWIGPDELLEFGKRVHGFDEHVEAYVVRKGWFTAPPSQVTRRWTLLGVAEIVLGVPAAVVAMDLPSSGLLLVGLALIAAGVATAVIARAMPARTMPGAMVRAMLAAYRRTLRYTMEQARSMQDVVRARVLPWLEAPDQVLVWGVALGLKDEVQEVLERTLEDVRRGLARGDDAWLPDWYGTRSEDRGPVAVGRPFVASQAGLMSASAVPDFGGMLAAIGTIGNAPSSGGSGSFGGGGSGGGGGGAGGGY